VYGTARRPGRCWPGRLQGTPRAEALSVFALAFLFLLPFYDLCLTYSLWRTFGTAPTRSRLRWRQPDFGEEKPSPAVRQNMQTSCSSLPGPCVQPTPSPLDPPLPPTEYWGPALARVGRRFRRAAQPEYLTEGCCARHALRVRARFFSHAWRNHALRSETFANVGVIALAVELRVRQHQPDAGLLGSCVDDGRQIRAVVPRPSPRELRQHELLIQIHGHHPLQPVPPRQRFLPEI